jgi:hypothetical protein
MARVLSDEFNEQVKRTVRESIRRERSNTGRTGRWHKKGGGGGSGEIMYFTIDAVNCPGDGNWVVTPTHYSGGCKAPPGADSYTGEYTVVPRSCPMPEMPDELIGQEGIAARVYNLETCELEWREIDHCPTIGC